MSQPLPSRFSISSSTIQGSPCKEKTIKSKKSTDSFFKSLSRRPVQAVRRLWAEKKRPGTPRNISNPLHANSSAFFERPYRTLNSDLNLLSTSQCANTRSLANGGASNQNTMPLNMPPRNCKSSLSLTQASTITLHSSSTFKQPLMPSAARNSIIRNPPIPQINIPTRSSSLSVHQRLRRSPTPKTIASSSSTPQNGQPHPRVPLRKSSRNCLKQDTSPQNKDMERETEITRYANSIMPHVEDAVALLHLGHHREHLHLLEDIKKLISSQMHCEPDLSNHPAFRPLPSSQLPAYIESTMIRHPINQGLKTSGSTDPAFYRTTMSQETPLNDVPPLIPERSALRRKGSFTFDYLTKNQEITKDGTSFTAQTDPMRPRSPTVGCFNRMGCVYTELDRKGKSKAPQYADNIQPCNLEDQIPAARPSTTRAISRIHRQSRIPSPLMQPYSHHRRHYRNSQHFGLRMPTNVGPATEHNLLPSSKGMNVASNSMAGTAEGRWNVTASPVYDESPYISSPRKVLNQTFQQIDDSELASPRDIQYNLSHSPPNSEEKRRSWMQPLLAGIESVKEGEIDANFEGSKNQTFQPDMPSLRRRPSTMCLNPNKLRYRWNSPDENDLL
jgi:hypothetical protein